MKSKLVILCCLFISLLSGDVKSPSQCPPLKVLIASPVRQSPKILEEFLGSLNRLEHKTFSADYLFVDDNDFRESSDLLKNFSKQRNIRCKIMNASNETKEAYQCDEEGHHWTFSLAWRVGEIKDRMIEYARDHAYDYIFSSIQISFCTLPQSIA